ncbi:hypothetical protein [Chthonobacter rhizosphaerae]|uniref:hypothetical protein n=1 Tax=Chthonobacter rhizosphaerae TaxID=2735553 RepID=UPI0015EF3E58|nr:hypothetical protein [Chthonobacter rhizosphaerae]
MPAGLALLVAAGLEIGGCWLVHAVLRLGWHPAFLLPAVAILLGFGWALTLVDTGGSGRTFAIYGGVYVAASLVWLRAVEGVSLTPFDLAGAALVLAGAGVIHLGARAG